MPASGRSTRNFIVLLLFLATVISYLNRQILSVNAPLIRDELQLSNVDYSRIVFSFLIAYTLGQAVWGWGIDRAGTRLGFSLAMIWWSLAGISHAFSQGMSGLAVSRFFLGLGEAGNWPGAMKAVSEWFPPRDRAGPAGLFGSGTSFGAIMAPPIVVFLTLRFGWRLPFVMIGLLGFVWLLVWLLTYWPARSHPRARLDQEVMAELEKEDPAGVQRVYWPALFRERKVWGVILGRMGADPAWWFFVFWLPEYLTRVRGYSATQIGYLGWIPYLAGYIGNVSGGFLSSYLVRRGMTVDRARKWVLYPSALGMTATLPAWAVESSVLNLLFISIATLAFGFWATNMLTVSADVSPPGMVGSITGLGGMGAGIGGMTFTLLTGLLVDHAGYLPVFVIATILPLGAAASVATLIGRIEPFTPPRPPGS